MTLLSTPPDMAHSTLSPFWAGVAFVLVAGLTVVITPKHNRKAILKRVQVTCKESCANKFRWPCKALLPDFVRR